MRLPLLTILLTLVTLLPPIHALPAPTSAPAINPPINCKSSSFCNFVGTHFLHVRDFHLLLTYGHGSMTGGPAPLDVIYFEGDTVACRVSTLLVGGVCLFLEGNIPRQGINVQTIVMKLAQLERHGCPLCGSVPVACSDEDGDMGRVVLNYVSPNYCNGICKHGVRGVREMDIKEGQIGGWGGEWPKPVNHTRPAPTKTRPYKGKPTEKGGKKGGGKTGGHE